MQRTVSSYPRPQLFPRRTWLESFSAIGLQVTMFEDDLPLYPRPANYIFGRRLHFIAQLRPR